MGGHSKLEPEGDPVDIRREPALLWIGVVAPIVAAISAFVFVADPTMQATVNAVAAATAGVLTAFLVKSDNLMPAITGLIQAVIVLCVGLGAGWDTTQQGLLAVALGLVASILVRDRVSAPVPAPTVSA